MAIRWLIPTLLLMASLSVDAIQRKPCGFIHHDDSDTVTYSPLPEKDGPYVNTDYEVKVAVIKNGQTGRWVDIPVLRCDVDTRKVRHAAFAEFDMASTVKVRVINHRDDKTGKVDIRPHSRKVKYQRLNDSIVEFVMKRPEYLMVEYGDERFQNLHILANSPLNEYHSPDEPQTISWYAPNAQDVFIQNPKLIYFGPGVHKPKDLPSGEIKIPSNCTVYLAPGAVVKARLIVDRAENVRIVGHGILDHPLRGVEITYSKNVLVDGITVLNPAHYTVYGGQSEGIVIRNVKGFSAKSWTDGIDLMCCKNVKIENCFLRTSDDCIALYNHRWWFWGGTENIDVSGCVFWPDVAHPVNIGVHGDDRADKGEVLKNVYVHDCDILFGREEGLMAVQCGDQNEISDIRFENIRIEGIQRGRVFDLRIIYSEKYNRKPGQSIDNVSFKNIFIDEDTPEENMMPCRVTDFDDNRKIGYFQVENVWIGKRRFDNQRDIIRSQSSSGVWY